ncbi:hypothetical protein [uncultured Vagococcus sp.]|uniref:hypothetical protein n=1 Tax=uncultured Vagococcus sp. TaxID=189676 RepID=UPI0028D63961|nr:hypothetical protein [uncultured Vagococcus sp.]
MNGYQEFHRLKKEIINSLISIEDGTRIDSFSDNMLEDKTNEQTFAEVVEMMVEASELVKLLVEHEKKISPDYLLGCKQG